jgi:PBP1b-binding outer membrane lipoprotein LpoB
MKNSILILLLALIFCSCNSEDVGKEKWNKKELMDSWAWKIFIFTDLGETAPIDNIRNEFEVSKKVNPIFVEDEFYEIDTISSFLSEQKVTFNEPIAGGKSIAFKRKK